MCGTARGEDIAIEVAVTDLYNMVRIIVGTLVEVGLETRTAGARGIIEKQ